MSKVLAEIQAKIKAPKDKENTFGKYKYRNAESILAAFKDVQPEGVALVMSDEVVMVGSRMFLVAKAALWADGVMIAQAASAAMHATEKKGMDDAQITGACSSYARKYALCGLFAIDDSTDDPDEHDHRDKAPKREAPPPFDPVAAHDRIVKLLEGAATYDRLADIWSDNKDAVMQIADSRRDLAKSCYEARDKRKAALQPADGSDANAQ